MIMTSTTQESFQNKPLRFVKLYNRVYKPLMKMNVFH